MKPSSLCNGVVEFLPTQWPMASSQLSRIRLQAITNRCEKMGLIGTFSLKFEGAGHACLKRSFIQLLHGDEN